jgi:osmoprotectant transport system substrate-binding protein
MMPAPRLANSAGRLCAIALAALGCVACGSAPTSSTTSDTTATTTRATTAPASSAGATGTSTATTATTTPLPGTGKPVITVGDKNYAEQFVLGQLYVQALRAQGYRVNINQNIGPTDVTVQALRSGSLTVYPEYLNTFNTAVAGYRHSFRSELAAYQGAQHYALAHGMQLLAPTPFSDTDGLAVTDAYAAANHLRTIGDLSRMTTPLTIGGPPQFQQGTPGLPALSLAYLLIPTTFQPMPVGDQYSALNGGSIQAADVNTTDGQLATGDYQLLGDPRHVFGWGNVVPVVSAQAIAAEGPAFAETIERVDDALTTTTMRELNQAVQIAQQDPAAAARQFLQTHGLLTPAPF